jgi:penicillin-binding protein 2
VALCSATAFASSTTATSEAKTAPAAAQAPAKAPVTVAQQRRPAQRRAPARRPQQRWFTSSYADDVTEGDVIEGEDPIVRAAAVEALGNLNGSVVAIDPSSGRILAMVNQKVALAEGFIPCSTIKIPVALAALNENLITRETLVPAGGKQRMSLTEAMAKSNNPYFEHLGRRLGFERVAHYARQFGLGELAGWNIEGERLGVFPSEPIPDSQGGVGKMCSFGEGIWMTPLQLGAMMGALANGGTLHYLQHPQSQHELASFRPIVKRRLNLKRLGPEVQEGLAAAVARGTGRNVGQNFIEEPVLGKTGTCSRNGTRFGWFASWADTEHGRIVLVVLLQGGQPSVGPRAAAVSGLIYRQLYDHEFFVANRPLNGGRTNGVGQ